MKTIDVYRSTNELDDATLDVMVTRLESRGKHPRFVEMMRDYLDAMEIDSADSVLDLGGGTGVAARAIQARYLFRRVKLLRLRRNETMTKMLLFQNVR